MSGDQFNVPSVRQDGLQLDEHRRFQEKFWNVERFAWGTFLVFIGLALLGLTGDGGIFARGTAITSGATLDYPRIARWEASDEFMVRFDGGGQQRSLLLSPEFAANFQTEHVQPSPELSEASAEGNRMTFRFTDGQPAGVKLMMRAKAPGLATYGIAVDEGAVALISILVLP